MIDHNAALLLAAGIFPAPTSGNTFIGGNKQPTTGKEEIARIDHQFNDKVSIFGHWISDQSVQTFGTTMWSGDNVPTIGNTYNVPSYSAVVHLRLASTTMATASPSFLKAFTRSLADSACPKSSPAQSTLTTASLILICLGRPTLTTR
jgi:hypothetical protein